MATFETKWTWQPAKTAVLRYTGVFLERPSRQRSGWRLGRAAVNLATAAMPEAPTVAGAINVSPDLYPCRKPYNALPAATKPKTSTVGLRNHRVLTLIALHDRNARSRSGLTSRRTYRARVRSRAWDAGDWRRRKTAGAFLLQVTPDLPNPADYEADCHRD